MKSKILNMMIIAIMVVGMIPTAAMAGTPADAPEAPAAQLSGPYVSPPVKPADTTGLPPAPTVDPLQDKVAREGHPARPMPKSLAATLPGFPNDPVVQTTFGNANMPAPLANFEGINNVDGVLPPDTNGEVGPNHYVQMVNLSMAIYDKSGNLLYGPFHPSDLWPSGDACNANNDGDPVVLYDQLADRWLVTQFAIPGPYYECIAVSKTGTPTNDPNDWYPYTFLVHNTKMNDYPHLGVWPDGYYMSANQFTSSGWGGAGAWVFDRASMLTGAAATFQYFDVSSVSIDYGGMLPTDLDGMTPPPVGSPNYFVEVDDSTWIGPNDALRIWEFHVDWANPANSTFGLAAPGGPNAILDTAPWSPLPCVGSSRSCIPQPDTSQGLDSIGDRLMFRLAYRNFGDHESLVVNHTVWADGTDRAGVRWYEIRDPGGTPVIYQQGTYAPADGNYRWMGSIAMDHVGNMAMGYSVSSSTVYPSIRYTGRLAGDPLGTMPQAEAEIIAGSGYQSSSYARWGDYSDITVDPVDDCTFWFTTEYIETSGDRPWQTRIASFKFPGCSLGPVGTLTGVVDDGTNGIPDALVVAEGITVTSQTTTDGNGVYTMTLPADTYTVTASAYGYLPDTVTGVGVLSGTVTTQDFTLAAAPMYTVSGTVYDSSTNWPLYASIDISGGGYPGGTIWTDPEFGTYSITLAAGITYTFNVHAWVDGYSATMRSVGPLTASVTEDFALDADSTCTAPGYTGTPCTPPADGGLLVGNVYDDNTGDALNGADVANDSGEAVTTVPTPDDANVDDGFFTIFSPSGTHTFTATLNSYGPDVAAVSIVDRDTVMHAFYLPAGVLSVSPDSMHVTLGMGVSTTLPLTLTNMGGVSANYELRERDGGFAPVVSIPAYHGEPPEDPEPVSMERSPDAPQKTGDNFAPELSFPLAGEPAFALDVYPGGNLVYIPDTTVPGTWNVIGSVSQFHPAGDFLNGDFSTLYALDYDTNEFVAIDTATAARTVIGTATPRSGESWSGMTGSVDGTLYASSANCGTRSTLYTVDPDTGTPTEIGEITGAACIIDIAINANGEMYGVDIVSDSLYQIDPNTAAATLVGALGVSANYAQGMDFEEETGVLYWAAYTTQGELRVIDTTTGASTLVGAFPSGAEVDALAFATGGATDVPWLSEDPVTGTVGANASEIINVTFDAGVPEITQPGDYIAQLKISHDTPYDLNSVPVTMTVVAPPTWGKLQGTITGLGYCDADPSVLPDAVVIITDTAGMTHTTATDASGFYSLWLDSATSPVEIAVDAGPDYEIGYASGVMVSAGVTTTQDLDLRWLRPCISNTPDAMEVTLVQGMSTTLPLTITNAGAGASDFTLVEANGGYTTALMAPNSSGGPDGFGYTFTDSNEPGGPTFDWIEISGTGQDLGEGDDDYVWPIDLPFVFNFYGTDMSQIAVGSNGTVYFEDDYLGLSNTEIPGSNSYGIDAFIAGYWDDLNPSAAGAVYYETVNYMGTDLAVVEWYQVPNYGTSDPVTYEVILFPNGSILLQYLDPSSEAGSGATVGIQGDTTTGLQYSYDTASLSPDLAICFTYPGSTGCTVAQPIPWLSEVPITGTVSADSVYNIDVTFDSMTNTVGTYTGTLLIVTDDPMVKTLEIPVTMHVVTTYQIYLPLIMKTP